MSLNNQRSHFERNSGTVPHTTNGSLNNFEEKDLDMENCPKAKRYNSILEYCAEIADELPQRQPVYVADLADILWKVQEWKKRLPNVEIFYAVKANADPVVLQLLCILGLSFDCASADEIQMLMDAGASPNDIIFANTIKPVEELKFASEKGVTLMTFDNEDELLKIHRVYPDARLVIRLMASKVSCAFDFRNKFGCSEEKAVKLIILAKQLNLTVVGVSFHVGSLCDDPESYASTIRTCRHLFDKARDIGFDFSILDIGSGFFGHSGTEEIFHKMTDGINETLRKHFEDVKVRVIAEPGTYIVSSAFRLVCTVIGRRCFEKDEEGCLERDYYLNDGIYGSFFRGIEEFGLQPFPLLPESEVHSRPKYNSRFFGHTCCSTDVIRHSITFPDLKIGERIVWENMGAYCQAVCTTFCGVRLPAQRYVFIKNQRLDTEWMKGKKNLKLFLKKHATFIGCEAEDI